MADNLKTKVLSGLIWKFGERISAQLVTLIVSIVLARLLEPEHFGAIAIVNIFIALANVFVVSGFGNSLIQKKESDNIDFSSVFYFSVSMSVILYGVVYISAPFIADFYKMQILSPVLRVLGIRLIVAGVNSVQHAYVSKHMLFKRFFWSTLFGTLLSGIVGIAMAYAGFGIWSLVAQYMVNTTVDTLVLWFTVKWRPVLKFSFERLKGLFTYGWKLLISELLNTGYNQLKGLVIGKIYTSSDLAYYTKGQQFPNLIVTNINTSIQSVLFPAMSEKQDKREQIKAITRRSIRISSYVMLPMMFGFALIAKPFVSVVLTDKWLPCVPFLQVYCFIFAMMPIHTSNLQAIKAIGRSDLFLKLEIIKKIIGIVALIISIRFGVVAIALSGLVTTIISSFINSFPNWKLLDYGYFEQIKDLFNGAIPLGAMCVAVIFAGFLNLDDILLMLVQGIAGALVYVVISWCIKNESFVYIVTLAKSYLKKHN